MKIKEKDTSSQSFIQFLKSKEQKREFLFFVAIYLIIFFLFKITYPYPSGTADSGSYILSAKTMVISGYRPIGYSWVIKFFHDIYNNISSIYIGQFIINAIAQLVFIFSIKYFFKPEKIFFYTASILFIISPEIVFCTNYIMSDSIFNSLTILFLATSIWLIKKFNIYIIIFHFIILYLLINIRYSALFYPVLSFLILLTYVRKNVIYVLLAIIPFVIIFKIYIDTKAETKKVYNIDAFSGFSGWALANNAVSILPYVKLDINTIPDKNLKEIHQICSSFPDSVYDHENINATSFMWSKDFPGKKVLFYHIQTRGLKYVNGWIYTGEQLKKYGSLLIKKYPLKFMQYFLYPNFKRLFYTYDIGDPETYIADKTTQSYFALDATTYDFKYSFFGKIYTLRIVSSIILWIGFLVSFFIFIIKGKAFDFDIFQIKTIYFLLVFFFLYAAFSIFSHPINNFRYMIPVYVIHLFIPFIILDRIIKYINRNK